MGLPNAEVSRRTRRIRVRRNPRGPRAAIRGIAFLLPAHRVARSSWRRRSCQRRPIGGRRTSGAQIGRSGSAPLLRAESRHAAARGAPGRGCPIPAAPVTALTRDNVAALLDERVCRWRGSHCSTWAEPAVSQRRWHRPSLLDLRETRSLGPRLALRSSDLDLANSRARTHSGRDTCIRMVAVLTETVTDVSEFVPDRQGACRRRCGRPTEDARHRGYSVGADRGIAAASVSLSCRRLVSGGCRALRLSAATV